MKAKRIIKLINNERVCAKTVSGKGCDNTSSDICPNEDYAACQVFSYDMCETKDLAACVVYSADYCGGEADVVACYNYNVDHFYITILFSGLFEMNDKRKTAFKP